MRQALRIGAWLAIVAGLVEAGLLIAHGRQIHGFIYLSPHLAWMAPLANVVWFGLAAGVLFAFSLLTPALRSPRAWLVLFLALAALSILLLPSQLHRIAAMALALGAGVQGSRLLWPRLERFDRIVRRTLWPLATLVVVIAAATIGWSAVRERRAMASLAAARDGAPNILLVVLDTVRRASLSLYGYERATWPAMERWASRGVRFDHAFSTASWTLPSHGSMFTGRFPSEMSAGWLTPLDATHPVIAERMAENGYRTAGFVANLLYCNRSFGLARGFHHYEDYAITPGELMVNSSIGRALSESRVIRRMTGNYDILGRKSGESITDRFLAWENQKSDRPYFAFLNYFDAHQPYLPDSGESFGPTADRNFALLEHRPYMGKIEDAETALTPAQVEAERNAYDATLRYLDGEMDRLLSELDRRGRLKNTIVIITSDHGEQFMEHGLFDHGNSLYRFATEVPLVMVGAGLSPAIVAQPVSLRNLPATILDLTEAKGATFPGQSLRRAWTGAADSTGIVLGETWGPGPHRRFQSVVAEDFHAIWSADSVELYSFSGDPNEARDLGKTPEGAEILARLRARFDAARPGQPQIP